MAMNKVKVNSDAELKDRLVAINRVTKVTKGGRTFTFAAIVVVGDGKGVVVLIVHLEVRRIGLDADLLIALDNARNIDRSFPFRGVQMIGCEPCHASCAAE